MNKFIHILKLTWNWLKHNGTILFFQLLMVSLNIIELLFVFIPAKKISLRNTLSDIANKIKVIRNTLYCGKCYKKYDWSGCVCQESKTPEKVGKYITKGGTYWYEGEK